MPGEFLLADADVLIDYQAGDLSVLRIVALQFNGLYVLQPVLATVDGLGEKDCARLGIDVISVETKTLLAAGSKSGLSPLRIGSPCWYAVNGGGPASRTTKHSSENAGARTLLYAEDWVR